MRKMIFKPVMGKEWIYEPYTEEDVEKFSEVLKKCPDPLDKHCKCAAHEYFYNRIYPSLIMISQVFHPAIPVRIFHSSSMPS
jgi:hypothetical protein